MAKDILINTQSGDLIFSDNLPQTAFWEVVWGKLFDSDESEYMNIVVPSGHVNNVGYNSDGLLECAVSAAYYPVDSEFVVRLVVRNVATGSYDPIGNYMVNAPEPTAAMYYPTYTNMPERVRACQLPLIDKNGKYKVLFKKYGNSNYSVALIASAHDTDFTIDSSDNQSAQLLARCAPGKYYRYPTTGLDLTKYINSVVEHTDLVDGLVSQFAADSKQIAEAEFDSGTGDLQVVFSGTDEADDRNLADPTKLDVELFKIADDEFIRAMYKKAQDIVDSNEEFMESLTATIDFMGLLDVGNRAKLDAITPSISRGNLNADGVVEDSDRYYVAEMELEAGRLYELNYSDDVVSQSFSSFGAIILSHNPLFVLYKNKKPVYIDEPFYTNNVIEYMMYKTSFKNHRCFVPLVDMTVKFYAGKSADWLMGNGYGVRPVSSIKGNYNSLLGLMVHPETGQFTGMVSRQSYIDSVWVDMTTNRILTMEQNTN